TYFYPNTFAQNSIYPQQICPIHSSGAVASLTCTCDNTFAPDAAGTKCVCPTGTQLNAIGSMCVEQFSLTLNAPPGDLEPTSITAGNPNSTKAMSVFVKSEKTGLPKGGAVVRVVLSATPAAPLATLTGCAVVNTVVGGYDCTTSATGYANFKFVAPPVPGSHTITAACTTPLCVNTQSASINVVCPTGMKPNAAGTACVEQLTIALFGLGGEVMPSATRAAYAQVTKSSDGSLKSGAQVALSLTVVPDSGSPTDPSNVGRLLPSSGLTAANGRLPFVFTAPSAGGLHTITATCTNCTNVATDTIKVTGCPVGDLTDIPILSALAAETLEQTRLTQSLEGGMDGYSLLSSATQTAEQCLADKINATPVPGYKVTSTVRTVAYQRHLRNVWDKFVELKSKVASDPSIQQSCQMLITKVEGEIGFRLTQDPANADCNAALGRAHCVRHEPAGANPRHTQNIAFDIPLATVDGYRNWLGQQAPPSTVAQQASTCGLTWGASFGDPIHFLLLQ
ncbi:MAG: hypothetical protein HOO95_01560, partial [Gallionella sp.]|nr:hypothetical protein [Gallionella sp.]